MPLNHGNKFYCQLLLDPHRYKLAEKLAGAENKKVTALLRDMVYAALEKALPASEYKVAQAADEAAWRESVKRRVEGRMRSKQEGRVSETDA
jgi:arginine/lysine/ornithine decarboxylase